MKVQTVLKGLLMHLFKVKTGVCVILILQSNIYIYIYTSHLKVPIKIVNGITVFSTISC